MQALIAASGLEQVGLIEMFIPFLDLRITTVVQRPLGDVSQPAAFQALAQSLVAKHWKVQLRSLHHLLHLNRGLS